MPAGLFPATSRAYDNVLQPVSQTTSYYLTSSMGYETMILMATQDQKNRLLKAKVAVALNDELGRVPTREEIDRVFLLTRVMYKAVLGLHYRKGEQKRAGQLALF